MIQSKHLKTALPQGTFSRGDPHPAVSGWFYIHYDRQSGEYWGTLKQLKKRVKQKALEYKRNSEKYLARTKQYYQDNKKSVKKYISQWKTENRHKVTATNAKRKALLKTNLTPSEQDVVNGVYLQCDRLNSIFGEKVFSVDHTQPLSKGGQHRPDNLQVVPTRWNLFKGNSHSLRWNVPYFGQRELNKRIFSE